MSVLMRTSVTRGLGELRHEPTAKSGSGRSSAGRPSLDIDLGGAGGREPRRPGSSYAVPVGDIHGTATSSRPPTRPATMPGVPLPDISGPAALDPSCPFAANKRHLLSVADVRRRTDRPPLRGD